MQREIENIIQSHVSDYRYGSRREDQTAVIAESRLFGKIRQVEGKVVHKQDISDCIVAWKSHATLQRQAGEKFEKVILEISVSTGVYPWPKLCRENRLLRFFKFEERWHEGHQRGPDRLQIHGQGA